MAGVWKITFGVIEVLPRSATSIITMAMSVPFERSAAILEPSGDHAGKP